ncbi:unnamed protein product [Closterium sp. NIES-64]|nr:unnamed protein product [Closterium sp. NIES-64]
MKRGYIDGCQGLAPWVEHDFEKPRSKFGLPLLRIELQGKLDAITGGSRGTTTVDERGKPMEEEKIVRDRAYSRRAAGAARCAPRCAAIMQEDANRGAARCAVGRTAGVAGRAAGIPQQEQQVVVVAGARQQEERIYGSSNDIWRQWQERGRG